MTLQFKWIRTIASGRLQEMNLLPVVTRAISHLSLSAQYFLRFPDDFTSASRFILRIAAGPTLGSSRVPLWVSAGVSANGMDRLLPPNGLACAG